MDVLATELAKVGRFEWRGFGTFTVRAILGQVGGAVFGCVCNSTPSADGSDKAADFGARSLKVLLEVWGTLVLVGWVGFLLGYPWCWRLLDGGYSSGRILGWVLWAILIGWPWALGLSTFDQASVVFALVSLSVVALIFSWRERNRLLPFLKERFWTLLTLEGVFLISYGGFAFLISHYPDIHPHWMERFQDFSILQGIVRSPRFPVEDPWFAGEPLVYYFFGHFMMAIVQVTLAAEPFSFFNPAVAAVQALLALGAFGLGLNLTRRRSHAVVCLFLTVFCGTLWPFATKAWTTGWRPIDWFGACRVIKGAMTEFPAFNILCADLHAHVIGFPLVLLSSTFVLVVFLDPRAREPGPSRAWRMVPAPLLILGAIVTGVQFATNTLDGFASLALWAAALMLGMIRHGPGDGRWIRAAASLFVLLVGSFLVSHPFAGQLLDQGRKLGWVSERSQLGEFLTHFGIPLSILVIAVVPMALRFALRWKVLLAMSAVGGTVLHEPLWGLIFLLIVVGVAVVRLFKLPEADPGLVWGLLAAFLSLLLLTICELIFVHATHGATDLGRAVTTNKLYLQAWLLLGPANAVLITQLALGRWRSYAKPAIVLLLAVGTYYPVLGAIARTGFFHPNRSLWAGRMVRDTQPGVWAAVQWLWSTSSVRPVILEATGESYTWQSRLATLSGGISVLGWPHHQAGWRNSWDLISQRTKLVDSIYRGQLSRDAIEQHLDRLRIELVAVGHLEREKYPTAAIQSLVAPYEKVFEAQGLALYCRGGYKTSGFRGRERSPD